jgi:hypothetical protein
MEYKSHPMMGQFKQRDKAVFYPSKGRPLGRLRHGLCELLGREIIDPQTESRYRKEEEEDKCNECVRG